MRNPFLELGKPKLENPRGEEVSGAFSCQDRGCYEVSTTARFVDEISLLTWTCKEGHISSIEEFKLV